MVSLLLEMSKSRFFILEIPSNFIRIKFSSEGQSILVISNVVFSIYVLVFLHWLQRFAAWRSGGFLAQKFNRSTALEPTTKLSYEAPNPPLRQTAVMGWAFSSFVSNISCLVELADILHFRNCNKHNSRLDVVLKRSCNYHIRK